MLQKEYEAKQKSVRAAFLQLHNWVRLEVTRVEALNKSNITP
jgi:hypothetical protein